VPNSRLRYYLIASKRAFDDPRGRDCLLADDEAIDFLGLPQVPTKHPLSHYLDEESGDDRSLALPDKTLLRYGRVLDIVAEESGQSCCFTKAYGKYAEGTGSVLRRGGDLDACYGQYERAIDDAARLSALRPLGLRFFSPAEIARLLGFPATFSFPEDTSLRQRYRVLGNSLSVTVVAALAKKLFIHWGQRGD